MTFVSGRPMQ